jgi:uncharacterized protein YjbJ (UPF0337 family)
MDEEPDRLRQDIEDTRASLTQNVDMLAEKTSPKKVAQRRWTAAKEKVMGSSQHTRHAVGGGLETVQDKARDVAGSVRGTPQAVARQAQGNPLAAGIIAFGAGMLAATLIPVTDPERRAGQQLKENAGDLTDRAKDMASDLKDDVSGSVQQAAGQVQDTARDAAQTTKRQARSGAQDVRAEAR